MRVNVDGSVTVVVWPASFGLTDDGRLRSTDGTVLDEGHVLDAGGGHTDDLRAQYGSVVDRCLADDDEEGIVLDVVTVDPSR